MLKSIFGRNLFSGLNISIFPVIFPHSITIIGKRLMNTFEEMDSMAFRADRTVNVILVTNSHGEQTIIYEYNREGLYYKLFFSLQKLLDYFVFDSEESFDIELYSDTKVYQYLTKKFTFGLVR